MLIITLIIITQIYIYTINTLLLCLRGTVFRTPSWLTHISPFVYCVEELVQIGQVDKAG